MERVGSGLHGIFFLVLASYTHQETRPHYGCLWCRASFQRVFAFGPLLFFRTPAVRFWCSGEFLFRRATSRGRYASFWHILRIIPNDITLGVLEDHWVPFLHHGLAKAQICAADHKLGGQIGSPS